MFALGAEHSDEKEKYLKLGADIASTCHQSYDRSGNSLLLEQILPLPVISPMIDQVTVYYRSRYYLYLSSVL